MRVCTKCNIEKDESNFYPNYSRKKGYYGQCKLCMGNQRKKWYINNKAKSLKYSTEYAKCNPERRKAIINKYLSSPKGVYLNIKKRTDNVCQQNEFINWYKLQDRVCHYCGVSEKDIVAKGIMSKTSRLTVDQIVPNDGYHLHNMTLACPMCNMVKGNYFTEDDMFIIGKIIRRKQQYGN